MAVRSVDSDWETVSTGSGRADDWETVSGGDVPQAELALDPEEKPGFFGGVKEMLIPDWDTVTTIVKAGGGNPQAAMQILKGIFGAQKEQFVKAGEAFSQGENVEGAGRVAAGMLPLVGPAAATAGERIGQGEVARGLGNVAGMLAPLGVGPALKGASRAAGKSSELLRESAVRQYSKVLGPTTKENKLITERVVPELLSRKVRALSRSGLEAKAEASAATANDALEAAYAALPQDASVEFGPVLRQIQKAKDDLVVKGTNQIVREDLHRALDKVQQKVLKIAGGTDELSPVAPKASVATARSARQEFDKAVSTKTKIFGKTGKETMKLAAEKEGGNSIRAELAKEYPDVAAINKEVNLWLNVKGVLGETITRTASQATPLGERIVTAGGMAGGLTRGLKSAVGYAAGLKMLSKLVNSTAWRTVSAVEKNRLADLLGAGKLSSAEVYAAKLAGGQGPVSGPVLDDIPPRNPSSGGAPNAATMVESLRGGYGQRQLTSGAGRRVDPGTRSGNQALRSSGVRGTLPETSATSADTAQEAIGILDAITEKYKYGLPTKTNELIFSERDARGVGTGRGLRNWVGENVDDIPILQDVPHGKEAIERALRVRKGKVWDRIVQEAEEYVRRNKEADRLSAESGDDIPF